jgi:hypothetical protein
VARLWHCILASTNTLALVFGGRDGADNYLNDLWILRAYNGVVTKSGEHWSGYGDGNLQSGANANGAGVTLTYQTKCAAAILPATSSSAISSSTKHTSSTSVSSHTSSSTSSPSSTSGSPSSSPTASLYPYDTNVEHKVLLPVSLVLGSLVLLTRFTPPYVSFTKSSAFSALIFVSGYGLAVAGIALAFTSIHLTSSLVSRSSQHQLHLKTGHGIAGLALAAAWFALAPVLGLRWWRSLRANRQLKKASGGINPHREEKQDDYFSRPDSVEAPGTPLRTYSNGTADPPLAQSTPNAAGRRSSDTEESLAPAASPVGRSFEVVNRPSPGRRSTTVNSLNAFAELAGFTRQQPSSSTQVTMPRSLADVSWLERRRSLVAVVCTFWLVFVSFDAYSRMSRTSLITRSRSCTRLPALRHQPLCL